MCMPTTSLGVISKVCLTGPEGADAAQWLCRRLQEAVLSHQTHGAYHEDLVRNLMTTQRRAALDGFSGGTMQDLKRGIRLLQNISEIRHNPLDWLPAGELLSCPTTRRPTRTVHRARAPLYVPGVALSRSPPAAAPLLRSQMPQQRGSHAWCTRQAAAGGARPLRDLV